MTRDEAIGRIKARFDKWALDDEDMKAIQTLIPELTESKDEKIRKELIEFIQWSEDRGTTRHDFHQAKRPAEWIAYLEKQKENIEKEYVFRPLAGTDITIAAEQAIRRADEGDRLVLAFNGAYIPVRKGCNANKIVDIYDAFIEKQKDASKAIEAVDRIDKYIDEHLANAHDMKDSNPDKKYYRGWDDALGKMAGILQDVYSGEKQEEEEEHEAIPVESTLEYKLGFKAGKESEKQKETSINWMKSDNVKNPDKPYIDKVGMFYTTDGRMCYASEIEKQRDENAKDSFERGIKVGMIRQQKEQKPIKWTDLTWKDIVELEGIINNVHYDFSAGIGQESFGKEVLERFRSTKGIEYLDEAEQKCWRIVLPQPHYAFEEGQKEQKPEWSEEDKEMLECVIMDVESAKKNYLKSTTEVVRQGAIIADKELAWLKALRPSWKPTEEEMKALKECGECKRCIKKLYEDLQKRYGTC